MNCNSRIVLLGILLGGWLSASQISPASLDWMGMPMPYGVRETSAPVSDSGIVAYIAPMPDRTDSLVNGFHASYIFDNGRSMELYPGYLQPLMELLGIYSKTTNIRIAARKDFESFAIIVEDILSGTTPPGSDVTVPLSVGVKLAVVNVAGLVLAETRIEGDSGNVAASQCRVSMADNGKILLCGGVNLGLRLYDSSFGHLDNFMMLDVDYSGGTASLSGDGSAVFFARRENASLDAICRYDVFSHEVVDTGGRSSHSLVDAQVSASFDGKRIAFRKSSSCLTILSWEEGRWREKNIDAPLLQTPVISGNGRYVTWQRMGTSCSQIFIHDLEKGKTYLASGNMEGEEADSACTHPAISYDGSRVTFVTAASNLHENSNGQKQVLMSRNFCLSQKLSLKKGWNPCALPFQPDESSVAAILDSGICWGWANGRFHQKSEFHEGQAFWMYALESKQIQITGDREGAAPLMPGWNFISTSSYPELANQLLFSTDGRWFSIIKDVALQPSSCAWYFK